MVTRGSVRTATASTGDAEASAQPATSSGRGRGRGQSRGAAPAPSVQVSVTGGRGRGRPPGTGRGTAPITDELLTERITQVLQATLPGMLAAATAARVERQTTPPRVERTDDNVRNENKKGCSYKSFSCTRPKEFHGEEGPVALMNWINKIERCFSICECAPEQKVKFAITTFCDGALHWWNLEESVRGEAGVATMTWEQMKELMTDKYCSRVEVKRLETEFLQLEQGDKTVQEYVNLFTEKSRFASHQVATEQRKIDRFIDGLRTDIRRYVEVSAPKTFVEAVEMAKTTEKSSSPKIAPSKEGKRKWEGSSKGSKQAKVSSGPIVKASGTGHPTCAKCGRRHPGECKAGSFGCFRCGKPGHSMKDCTGGRACYECGSTEHLRNECPMVQRGQAGTVKAIADGSGKGLANRKDIPKAKGLPDTRYHGVATL